MRFNLRRGRGGLFLRGIYKRTASVLPKIEKHLRGGKTLKEIAFILKRDKQAMFKLAERNPNIRNVLEETYHIRYPNGSKTELKLRQA